MAIFVAACTVVTLFTMKNEPQYVRVTEPAEGFSPSESASDEAPAKININTATAEELQSLSGIGEVTAGKIIAYREEHGGFLFVEEIMEVSGIGTVIFERIKDYIYVE